MRFAQTQCMVNSDKSIYIDRNAYDKMQADPLEGCYYDLKNAYSIEDGHIFLAGIAFELKNKNGLPMSDNSNHADFMMLYERRKIRFDPNTPNQEENIEKHINRRHRGLFKTYLPGIMMYDRPTRPAQRLAVLCGILDALRGGTQSCLVKKERFYLDLDAFYLSGFRAVKTFQIKNKVSVA